VVRVRGNLRGSRTYRNAIPITVGGRSLWVKSAALIEEIERPDALARASGALRRRLFPPSPGSGQREDTAAGEGFPASRQPAGSGDRDDPHNAPEVDHHTSGTRPGLALARAFLLGDGRALPPDRREAMRRLGLAHLVAVSGLNVGMVAGVLLIVLLRAPRPVRLFGTLVGICGYALLVGPLPSLLRALVMAAVVLVALLLRRLPAAVNALAAACLLLVVLDPSWADDLGFQLSVAATVGLMALTPPLMALLRGLGWLAGPLAVTLAAQLATLPWALAEFHRLSPAAPLANLVAVPWAAVVLAVALSWAFARLAGGVGDEWLLAALDLLARPLAVLDLVPAGPWVTFPATASWPAAVLTSALLCWAVVRPRPAWRSFAAVAMAVAMVVCVQPARREGLALEMLDVGQGDAVLLRDGAATLLVDGGGWRGPGFGGRVLVPALAGLGVRRLDAIAVTHGDDDHCGGAADLVRELEVAEVWVPTGLDRTGCGRRLVAAGGPEVVQLPLGERRRLGRWRLEVLGPADSDGGGDNGRSLVLRATAGGRCVFLTGDLEARGERALLARQAGGGLGCEVLKVAHHGSRSSSGRSFLKAVAPRLALISAGAGNAYGHPAPSVLAALHGSRVWVLRTDRQGMVRLAWEEDGPLRVEVAAP
jgi:competence protein ComEC